LLARHGRLTVRAQRERFLIGAAHVAALGHVLCSLTHADVRISKGLHQHGARAVVEAALWNHRHRLHAHAQKRIACASFDLRRGEVDRGHRRAAEAIDRHPTDLLGELGEEADDAREVIALRRLGIRAAEDDVLQERGI
jgi:hypothetical protein